MYSADYQSVSVRLFVTISHLYNNINNEALVVRQLLKKCPVAQYTTNIVWQYTI